MKVIMESAAFGYVVADSIDVLRSCGWPKPAATRGYLVVAKDCGKLANPLIVDGQVDVESTATNTVSLELVETDHDEE